MSGFLQPYPLFSCPSGDGRNFVLSDYLYYTTSCGTEYRGIVGATTDGASTPREIWNVYPPFGKYWLAAILHDFAYRGMLEEKMDSGLWVRVQLPFNECNDLLMDAMKQLGIDILTRNIIYNAVKVAGQDAFLNDLAQPDIK
jgi:hypothetical protein